MNFNIKIIQYVVNFLALAVGGVNQTKRCNIIEGWRNIMKIGENFTFYVKNYIIYSIMHTQIS